MLVLVPRGEGYIVLGAYEKGWILARAVIDSGNYVCQASSPCVIVLVARLSNRVMEVKEQTRLAKMLSCVSSRNKVIPPAWMILCWSGGVGHERNCRAITPPNLFL